MAVKKTRKKTSPKAQKVVKRVMEEFKEGELESGKSGRQVKNQKQAVAIGLSEARKEGAKVAKAPKRKVKKKTTKKAAPKRKTAKRKTPKRKTAKRTVAKRKTTKRATKRTAKRRVVKRAKA